MKYLHIAIATTLLVSASIASYVIYEKHTATYFLTDIDVTDTSKIHIDTTELLGFYKAKTALWGQTTTELQAISALQYNQVYRANMPSQFPLLSNPDERQGEFEQYYNDITSYVASITSTKKSQEQSSIYSSVVRQLNALAKLKEHNRYAIFYSDCQENTDIFSLYKKNDSLLIKEHPDKVRTILSHFGTVENLHGITIYFIYQSQNAEDENRFLLMAGFLEQLFEEHGATVSIGHNLAF